MVRLLRTRHLKKEHKAGTLNPRGQATYMDMQKVVKHPVMSPEGISSTWIPAWRLGDMPTNSMCIVFTAPPLVQPHSGPRFLGHGGHCLGYIITLSDNPLCGFQPLPNGLPWN